MRRDFRETALNVFRHQFDKNPLYGQFCRLMGRNPDNVAQLTEIPFLPVSFFKTHNVISGNGTPEAVFESSCTTGDIPARHAVLDLGIYEKSLISGFEAVYGPAADFAFLALLPSYIERPNASLVHMVQCLMNAGKHPENGFYTDDYEGLAQVMPKLRLEGRKTMLFGVTFALLEFAERFGGDYSGITVLETGGMKGRRNEMTREAVHEELQRKMNLNAVHSEYGMTELLSQAYSTGEGIFRCASTMKVRVRDPNDPRDLSLHGGGCLNIIDLANINSCSFIATDDLGTIYGDGSFEVTGRKDHADLRGCNLMFFQG